MRSRWIFGAWKGGWGCDEALILGWSHCDGGAWFPCPASIVNFQNFRSVNLLENVAVRARVK